MSQASHKRLTIDISTNAHRQLKGACVQQGVTMREFVLAAIYLQLEEFEHKQDLLISEEVMRRIRSGEEELVSWDEMEKRLGWDAL